MTLSKKVRRVIAIRDGKISSERVLKEEYSDRIKESNIDWRAEDTQDEYAVLDRAGRVQIPKIGIYNFIIVGSAPNHV